jgi:hypothetical protein
MSKPWTWIAPSILVILAGLLAGPLLSSLALVQSVSVANLQLSGPHTIRLVADLFAFAILWILAFAAFQQIPSNGRGSSFLRDLASAKLYTRAAGKSPHGASYPLNSYLISMQLPNYFRGEH